MTKTIRIDLALHPVRTATRAEAIREVLADEIVRGALPPGIALDETAIALKFNVSRTPVREAIRQLEAIGLVEARPRRGAVVSAVTDERLDEMFLMMLELEALCAREAAKRMSKKERDSLQALHRRGGPLAKSNLSTEYISHNTAFHDAIYSGTHNRYLAEITLSVRRRLAPFRRFQFAGEGRLSGSQQEHQQIVSAILAGDSTAAAEAMRSHIQVVRDAYNAIAPTYQLSSGGI